MLRVAGSVAGRACRSKNAAVGVRMLCVAAWRERVLRCKGVRPPGNPVLWSCLVIKVTNCSAANLHCNIADV